MRIYIQTQGFELTPAIDSHVRRQLVRNLAGSEDKIIAVDVFLGDINGPKGGMDKKALVCVQLAQRLSVRFETIHSDLYRAVTAASRKARRSVKRTLRRHSRIDKAELRGMRQFSAEYMAG
ncbi:MAG: HPF/RaiA family ribosome-associated protein [Gammaproteobacteria bacterium]|jgi:putative sigma-54 modulation protein|nr:HPF/RaiA family ribosome-associated protein [Gammaproteobacteria bacterium]MDH5171354.1 HPF/RaiA family ribosome-associated protein [Gammaproteobacteria bacterium]